jgi:hypothetical protein
VESEEERRRVEKRRREESEEERRRVEKRRREESEEERRRGEKDKNQRDKRKHVMVETDSETESEKTREGKRDKARKIGGNPREREAQYFEEYFEDNLLEKEFQSSVAQRKESPQETLIHSKNIPAFSGAIFSSRLRSLMVDSTDCAKPPPTSKVVPPPPSDKRFMKASPPTKPKVMTERKTTKDVIQRHERVPPAPRVINQATLAANDKQKLLINFNKLRKRYPNASIPDFTMFSDYDEMVGTYERIVSEIKLDIRVQKYRTFLKYTFIAIQFGLVYFFKSRMEGYAKFQIEAMSEYEDILVEIGEDDRPAWDEKYGPFTRLGIAVLYQTMIFVGMKFVDPSNIMSLLGSFMAKNDSSEKASVKTSDKMKGPSINPDDI